MKWLVPLHVLSSVIGIGPPSLSGTLLRRGQTLTALRQTLALSGALSTFPKVGGTLAVLSGLALVWLGDYGPIIQLWLLGSLALYVPIQLVVGYAAPRMSRLAALTGGSAGTETAALPPIEAALLGQVRSAHLVAGALGVLLFALMILKPV